MSSIVLVSFDTCEIPPIKSLKWVSYTTHHGEGLEKTNSGGFSANALRKNACAAAIPRSRRSRKPTVLPCLSTARYR
jgi:hypothetical protein